MAVSAFKSTSRRGTSSRTSTAPLQPASNSASCASGGVGKAAQPTRHRSGGDAATKVVPPRRSRSVSAFSRTNLSVDSDFANKRDNPLYWSAEVDSPRLDGGGAVKVAKFDGAVSRLSGVSSKISSSGGSSGNVGSDSRRGRSVTRTSDSVRGKSTVAGGCGGNGRGVGRSLSRVDTGRRRRSVSRGHYGNSEREREQGSTSLRSRSKTDSNVSRVAAENKSAVARSDSDLSELLKVWQAWSSQQDVSGSSFFLQHWEDGVSLSSSSDAEERISKPVSEVVNSQERARKLRAELAVEQHREVELNKILDEMIEQPEKPDVKKPRAIRKASRERRKMSRRLEEEALAYFDECVSISTFDGSDFSSLEDPLSNVVGGAEQIPNRMTLPGGSASVSISPCPAQSSEPSNRMLLKNTTSHSLSNSTSLEAPSTDSLSSTKKSWKRQFSFADKKKDSSALTQELRSYVKIFTKDGGKKETCNTQTVNQHRHDTDEYVFSVPTEKFLFERLALKYRIDSGGMLLCGGATGFSSPFSNLL